MSKKPIPPERITIQLRVPSAEKSLFLAHAEQAMLSLPQWIRHTLRAACGITLQNAGNKKSDDVT